MRQKDVGSMSFDTEIAAGIGQKGRFKKAPPLSLKPNAAVDNQDAAGARKSSLRCSVKAGGLSMEAEQKHSLNAVPSALPSFDEEPERLHGGSNSPLSAHAEDRSMESEMAVQKRQQHKPWEERGPEEKDLPLIEPIVYVVFLVVFVPWVWHGVIHGG